jgi:NADH dehydrogenase/NADH:ubiquinone oxidoreductase subunit G
MMSTLGNLQIAAAAVLKDVSGGSAGGGNVLVDGGCTLEEMFLASELAATLGGKARFAAATEEADEYLMVAERGANAGGADMLGLARAKKAAAATVLMIERDANVPADLRDGSGALVVFATDGEHVPSSAQVVFPLGSWAERDGLLVNTEGYIQRINRNAGIGPDNLADACEVLEELLGEIDDGYDWRGRDGIVAAIQALPKFAESDFPAVQGTAGVGARS